jgi:hypothetical protein
MKQVLCLAIGHDKQSAPFSSIRFACRRCGLDLGTAAPAWPLLAEARVQRDVLRGEAGGAARPPGSPRVSADATHRGRSLGNRGSRRPSRGAFPGC